MYIVLDFNQAVGDGQAAMYVFHILPLKSCKPDGLIPPSFTSRLHFQSAGFILNADKEAESPNIERKRRRQRR